MTTLAIVGAGAQLGRAIAARFAAEGYDLALIARRRDALESLAEDLSRSGARVAVFPADVTNRPALTRALADAEDHFGTIDVLEYSPAPSPADLARAPLVEAAELTVESVRDQLDLHLYGGIAAIGQVLPGMLERGAGTVFVTSGAGAGSMIIPQVANAQIASAGLRNWILNLHRSVAGRGVYAAHVGIAAYIGQGRPASEPEVIADTYWTLHSERTRAEFVYDDMPADGFQGVADRFRS